jgi:hypothetical protein
LSLTFPSLVTSDGEEGNDADHDAKDIAAAKNDNDDNDDDDNDATMPPKAKPVTTAASKPAKKKAKKAEEITHLPAPDIRTYSIEAGDPFTVSYYASGKHDYADVVFRVNGTMEYGEYEVQVAKDGRSILFVCAIRAKSFNKTIL